MTTDPDITTIADIVRVHAARRPDAVALIAGEHTLTFAELDARTSQAAQAFRAAGVGFGDRVALIEKNGVEFFEVLFGLAKLGAIGVPVNWRLAPPEMAHIIDDAAARVVVVGAEFVGHVEAIEDQLTVDAVVVVGAHSRWQSFDAWVAAHPAEDPGITTVSDDIAFLMYTSGTTGLPKGVMLSNANYFNKTTGVIDKWRFDADSVSLVVMPMFHMAGSGWALVGVYQGCPTVVLRDVDPRAILDSIARHRITNMLLVPAVIQMLLAAPGVESYDFSSVRAIVYGASPITDDVLLKGLDRIGCEFQQVYGMTETTGSITQLDAVDHDPVQRPELLRSCGKPYEWVQIQIVDDDGNPLPANTIGEVWTRSSQNMLGYWNNPQATASTVTADGWLKTGDAGYVDGDGYLYLNDRKKDMIVSGGENIYPTEVENVLMTHPAVADVAVIGVPDAKWGEAVKAVVVVAADTSEAELIAYARDRLGGFKLPKSVDFVTTLPRNASGKLLKRELREPYWQGVERRIG
jgi:long-chain acyl-CoA synthetase